MAERLILAGDVGGTKIHLGLFDAETRELTPKRDQIFATRDCASLEDTIGRFLDDTTRITAACFGVPGPIIEGVARPVNIEWEIDQAKVSVKLGGVPVRLLNDLETMAWGTLHVGPEELVTLQAGAGARVANRVVIAAGTGLGEAGMVRDVESWRTVATEGGHADFAPRGGEQIELLNYLVKRFEHVSVERVLSGPGLRNIYDFVMARGGHKEPEWLSARMRDTDHSAVISETGLDGSFAPCAEALRIFVEIYGAEAGNLALKYLAIGGVYVGGGIAPKILPALQGKEFVRAFIDKGRLQPTMEQMPVHVCLTEDTALRGAAHVAAAIAVDK